MRMARSELHGMNWQDGADGFDFQDKLARDDDIRLEAVADFRALIEDGNCDLPGEGNACVCQFPAQVQIVYDPNSPGPLWSPRLTRGCTSVADPATRSVNGSARSIPPSP
jgi:hypothetical protein